MRALVFVLALILPTFANGQSATTLTGHKQPQESSDAHASGVDRRGDHAMGFSHETSTHRFRLLPDGGAIEVTANSPNDKISRDEIRSHLSHIAQMFTNGNFQVPPGVPVTKSNRANITYVFEPILNGGRVRIKTTDAEALRAVHQFLTLSRCTQFPEYVLEGHYAAPKSRNPPCVLYLNPGTELRQGNGIGSFWHSNPGRTLA
jgi:hypothetical protein